MVKLTNASHLWVSLVSIVCMYRYLDKLTKNLSNRSGKYTERYECQAHAWWHCEIMNRTEDRVKLIILIKNISFITSQVPAVHLVGNIMFFPNEFLQSRIPQLLQKFIDRKQVPVVTSSRESFLSTVNQNLPRYGILHS